MHNKSVRQNRRNECLIPEAYVDDDDDGGSGGYGSDNDDVKNFT